MPLAKPRQSIGNYNEPAENKVAAIETGAGEVGALK